MKSSMYVGIQNPACFVTSRNEKKSTMQIDRETLLKQLEIVAPGTSTKDIIEQSSCVVFRDGFILSYNSELACRLPTEVELSGAIHANTLLDSLRKMKEDLITIEEEENQIVISGRSKKIGIRREATIELPIEKIETPGKWFKLPEVFNDALQLVSVCASKDEQKFTVTCVQLHPEWIQATDDYQVAQYRMELSGLETDHAVRASTIKQIIPFAATKMSVTENWVHFRSPIGLIISCRQHVVKYPDTTRFLEQQGVAIKLPKALIEAAELAEVFSSQNPDKNEITITLKPGKMIVYGEGNSGWSRETKKIKYNGDTIKFRVIPKLLRQIAENHNECEICERVLKVTGGSYTYVNALELINEDSDNDN